jgi:hypothetical protein
VVCGDDSATIVRSIAFSILLAAVGLACGRQESQHGVDTASSSQSIVRVAPERLPPGTTNAYSNLVAFSDISRRRGAPRFEQFATREFYRGKPAPVDLRSYPGAREYRTVLRDGARAGPNFAGHLTLVDWGCGSPCVRIAIIHARSGHILYMTPDSAALTVPPIYRLDSRLLVEDPTRFTTDTAGHPIFAQVEYYEWIGRELVLRDSIAADTLRVPLDSIPWICCPKHP